MKLLFFLIPFYKVNWFWKILENKILFLVEWISRFKYKNKTKIFYNRTEKSHPHFSKNLKKKIPDLVRGEEGSQIFLGNFFFENFIKILKTVHLKKNFYFHNSSQKNYSFPRGLIFTEVFYKFKAFRIWQSQRRHKQPPPFYFQQPPLFNYPQVQRLFHL